MKSMTGFGSSRAQTSDVSVEVSVRTVNGRFLETRFHLPREFLSFEGDLRKALSQSLRRGTVDVFVQRRVRQGGVQTRVTVNLELARQYREAHRRLAKEFRLKDEIGAETLARWPDVIRAEEKTEADAREKAVLSKAFQEALDLCGRERVREGKALRKELEKLLKALEREIATIQSLRLEANKQLQERFETRLAGRLKGGELDPARLSQEIVLQIDKSDINEELQRLAEHVKNYRQLVSSREAEGKKMDFYTQELLREVNTIGSKSQVARITQSVVEAKTLIERLREQVQNVE